MSTMTISPVANQHLTASGYAPVLQHNSRTDLRALVRSDGTPDTARQIAGAAMARTGAEAAFSVPATATENNMRRFEERSTTGNSTASGNAKGARGSSTLEPDAGASTAPEQARADLPQLGAVLDVYL